jgi:hypothetical protein
MGKGGDMSKGALNKGGEQRGRAPVKGTEPATGKPCWVVGIGASVVTSVIDIAHNLGLTAVAEGVETQEQLAFLAGCGCDLFQGYLFSKPLPAEEFADLLREGHRLTSW